MWPAPKIINDWLYFSLLSFSLLASRDVILFTCGKYRRSLLISRLFLGTFFSKSLFFNMLCSSLALKFDSTVDIIVRCASLRRRSTSTLNYLKIQQVLVFQVSCKSMRCYDRSWIRMQQKLVPMITIILTAMKSVITFVYILIAQNFTVSQIWFHKLVKNEWI